MTTRTATPPAEIIDILAAPDRAGRYDPAVIEEKWRQRWARDNLYRVDDDAPGDKWYSLTMYPYPSGVLHGIHPAIWTFDNSAAMRRQYDQMGAMIDWSREIASCTPEFYRWNQW